jgi:hypothetical protein
VQHDIPTPAKQVGAIRVVFWLIIRIDGVLTWRQPETAFSSPTTLGMEIPMMNGMPSKLPIEAPTISRMPRASGVHPFRLSRLPAGGVA